MRKTTTHPISNREKIIDLLTIDKWRDRLFFALSLFTALRIGEVRQTKWGDIIDFEIPKVKDKGTFVQLKKRKDAEREILLHPELKRIIWEAWLEAGQPPAGIYCIMAERGRRGHRPMSPQSLNRMIKGYCEELGIETKGNRSSHMLRKTMARTFFENSVANGDPDALELTALMLGHSSTVSTMKYLGLTQDVVDQRIGSVDYGSYTPSLWEMLQTGHPLVANWKIAYEAIRASVPGDRLREAIYVYLKKLPVPDSVKTHDALVEVIGNLLDE